MSKSEEKALSKEGHRSKNNEIELAAQKYWAELEANPNSQWALAGLNKLQRPSAQGPPSGEELSQQQIGELRALYNQGKLDEAQAFGKALATQFASALFVHIQLGIEYAGMRRFDLAAESFKTAAKIDPDFAVAHFNLGNCLKKLERFEEAIASYENALQIKPGYVKAHEGLATALEASGKLEEAIASNDKALLLNPVSSRAHNNRGNALSGLGRLEDAIVSYSRALEIDPGLAQAHNNLGMVLMDLGKPKDAIARYHKALQIAPNYVDAFYNLGIALAGQGKHDEAAGAYLRALRIRPDHVKALNNLGQSLQGIGKFKEAIACYRKVLQINPDDNNVHSNIICMMQYDPDMEPTSLKQESVKWWEAHGKNLPCRESWTELDMTKDRPLRIGMVSPNFKSHPVGFLVIQLIENSAHVDMQFYCYSERSKSDEYASRFEKSVDHWSNIDGLSDLEVIDKIQQDQVDILFDLSGHFGYNRLMVFASKPAPIQVAWLGFGTRGLPTIDYLLADRFHIPKSHEDQYSEKVIRLPEGYACFDPPGWSLPVSPLPARRNGLITFACFNNPIKINEKVLEKWARILNLLPNSRLVLKYVGMDTASNKKRVLSILSDHGVDGSRITFEGKSTRKEMLERYHDIDIALDTWPYSGGVITCEALWMGVPVVTTPGQTFAGRHSFSHLRNVGLIAESLDDYVETAVSLATDIETLSSIRSGLREKMAASPLCDGPRFATDFGVVMRQIWTTFVDREKAL